MSDLAMARNRPRPFDRAPTRRHRRPHRPARCAFCVRVAQLTERSMRRQPCRMRWRGPMTFHPLPIALADGRPRAERVLRSLPTDGSFRHRDRGAPWASLLDHLHPTIHLRRRMRAGACLALKTGRPFGASRPTGANDAAASFNVLTAHEQQASLRRGVFTRDARRCRFPSESHSQRSVPRTRL